MLVHIKMITGITGPPARGSNAASCFTSIPPTMDSFELRGFNISHYGNTSEDEEDFRFGSALSMSDTPCRY